MADELCDGVDALFSAEPMTSFSLEPRWLLLRHRGGDEGAPVAALGDVALVAEAAGAARGW
jgi:hypothetical protein